MDTELLSLAADRLCEDYNGEVDALDINLGKKTRLKGDNRIHKIVYDDKTGFHFYHRQWVKYQNDKKVSKVFKEIELTDEEVEQVLEEFYAWY